MKFISIIVFPLIVLGGTIPASTVPALDPPLPTRTIFQLQDVGDWIENIAVRSNGDLLFTQLLPEANLYTVKNPQSSNPQVELIYNFQSVTGLYGIAEIWPDVFVIAGNNVTASLATVPGSGQLWQVDFHTANRRGGGSAAAPSPIVTKILDFPYNSATNGITAVPGASGIALVANSLGSLLRVDASAKTVVTESNVTEMAPVPNARLTLGINGVKIRDGHLYWTNSLASTVYRLPLDHAGLISPPDAQAETVLTVPGYIFDDFNFGADGTVWVATNANNTILAATGEGQRQKVVAAVGGSESTSVEGVTAVVFGRTPADKHVLYAVTSGGLAAPINGTLDGPGKVVAIDTSGFGH
ncbi:hypothetical protein BX600DRAFT_443049 [Xylariales sp. PMI_506]|nr:hypothetical protein BX600DRAFT_443049 [Xylariales sp. PMI_506]